MSKLVLNGDTSGSVTLDAPAVSGTTTLTLPVQTGTVMVNGPAFSAYQSTAQTALAGTTWTKIVFQTEEFDTASAFDSTTNYRFTPLVAGYYQVNAAFTVGSAATTLAVSIYKNGSAFKNGTQTNTSGSVCPVSALIYMNGSTDYIEFYALTVASQAPAAGVAQTYFQAAMVRSA